MLLCKFVTRCYSYVNVGQYFIEFSFFLNLIFIATNYVLITEFVLPADDRCNSPAAIAQEGRAPNPAIVRATLATPLAAHETI